MKLREPRDSSNKFISFSRAEMVPTTSLEYFKLSLGMGFEEARKENHTSGEDFPERRRVL